MVELTPREWQVYEAIKQHKTGTQIATELGVSPRYVSKVIADLHRKGAIRRIGDHPPGTRYEIQYPWEPTDTIPVYKPMLPPDAKLRVEYPRDAERDVTVAPIRHLWWPWPNPIWSVQGIPMLRPDGRPAYELMAEHRVVVVTALESTESTVSWCFLASIRSRWSEQATRSELGPLTDIQPVTLMVATAIGVDAILDISFKVEGER